MVRETTIVADTGAAVDAGVLSTAATVVGERHDFNEPSRLLDGIHCWLIASKPSSNGEPRTTNFQSRASVPEVIAGSSERVVEPKPVQP